MCGVSGSFSLEEAFSCYEDNLNRGFYSSSVTVVKQCDTDILSIEVIKKKGRFDSIDEIPKGRYYLFHSRGPTVETKEFRWDQNHPFINGHFIVAHNGIIENAQAFGYNCPVDSQIIPWLIDDEYKYNGSIGSIRDVADSLNQLEGTFGCWILDMRLKCLYIVRHDVSLFVKQSSFSSSPAFYMDEAPSDVLMGLDLSGGAAEDEFKILDRLELKTKSKYFIAPAPKN